jgi:hypothetical protein
MNDEEVGGGFGGTPKLTRETVAAPLARCYRVEGFPIPKCFRKSVENADNDSCPRFAF